MIDQKRLTEIVGTSNVSNEKAVLQEYSRDISFVSHIRPAWIVKVENPEQVAKLVNLARATNAPLVPVSSGTPHFRGDTVPGTGGAIVVDLSGMKKILRVDRKNRVAMFEPGVTFGELSREVAKYDLRLNMPLLPRPSKSVVGSLLEREPVIMPKYHWDISDPLACTEIVFGTGDLFRTGAAAGSGTIEQQWKAGGSQKEAAGPSSSSWYRLIQGSQGTMGIVTWVSARCELIPKLEEPFFVGSSQLSKILDTLHWLIRLRLVNECLVLNKTELALIMAASGKGDYSVLKEQLPPWILFFNIASYNYLSAERLHGQEQDMIELCQKQGVEASKTLGAITADDFLKIVQSPSVEPYWKLQHKSAAESVFFLTIYDKIFDQISMMFDSAAQAGYPAPDLGVYIQPIVQGVNYHCEFDLFYDSGNSTEMEKIRNLSHSATLKLLNRGAFFSRPYGENTSLIMNRDAASMDALRKVKSIVDPNHIMNPGKLCF
jgi:FAD/FMN-containing dehydrogenase